MVTETGAREDGREQRDLQSDRAHRMGQRPHSRKKAPDLQAESLPGPQRPQQGDPKAPLPLDDIRRGHQEAGWSEILQRP